MLSNSAHTALGSFQSKVQGGVWDISWWHPNGAVLEHPAAAIRTSFPPRMAGLVQWENLIGLGRLMGMEAHRIIGKDHQDHPVQPPAHQVGLPRLGAAKDQDCRPIQTV